jgi:glycosyltransferase involved in cell wall biosynthesis
MDTLKVRHINFAKGFRGGERQTLNLIEGLAELGVEQALVCHSESELHAKARQANIATLAAKHPLLGHLGVPRFTINHVHEARGAYWAAIEHSLRGTPYLITRRIPNPVSGSAFNNFAYRHAARLVGVSRDVAMRLERQTGRPVEAILDSCSVRSPDPRSVTAIRQQLGGGPIIGHVGALQDHHKGQSILIAAFQDLLAHHPDARLVLLGEGPDKELFQRQAKGDSRIVFAGFQADVAPWIAAMDVFVFPSREEGLGSSVLDAMLLGVPVISSAAGGLPELVGRERQRGMMVTLEDPKMWSEAISQMLANHGMRTRMRVAAQEFAMGHDIDAMTRDYLALYRSVIELQGAPPTRTARRLESR